MRTIPQLATPLIGLASLIGSTVYAMEPLDDDALSQVSGQAAFYTGYIAPGGSNPNSNIGFFTLGLNGTLSLNANIDKIQLGCGGVNGSGCDINLNQVSISGLTTGTSGTYADSDATLNNPFIQLAILNPNSLSTRQVVGLYLGAQNIIGQLSIGMNNNTSTAISNGSATAANNTGIQTLSGSLGVTLSNTTLTNVNICLLICTQTSATISSYTQQLNLAHASTISDFGPMTATSSLLGLTLSNVHLKNEPLAAIHNILINNASAGLSLESMPITWPTTSGWSTSAAQVGWWLSLPNIAISNVTTNQSVSINALTAVAGVLGSEVDISAIDLAQQHISNCYGGLKFC